MPRYFLTLSYDGSAFNGWQVQRNTQHTVQQVLEEKMAMLFKEKIKLTGCGRTDTGVNARNFAAHFDTGHEDLAENKNHWIYKINTVLPGAVAIQDLRQVDPEAHARFDATQRVYHYYLLRQRNPFRQRYSWFLHGELDFEAMNRAAQVLQTEKDFTSFSKLRTQNKTTVCDITRAQWLPCGVQEWCFVISADRFLRGMVRAIVGTLVMVGRNKITIDDFHSVIAARNRKAAGSNAPPQGLFFAGVKYPETIFL